MQETTTFFSASEKAKGRPLALKWSLFGFYAIAVDERRNGYVGRSGDDMLKDFDVIVAEAEAKYEV